VFRPLTKYSFRHYSRKKNIFFKEKLRILTLKGLEAGVEAGNFARTGIFVDNALGNPPHHSRLGQLERGGGGGLVAGGNRLFHLADDGADLAPAVLIDGRTFDGLTGAFLRRRMGLHGLTLCSI
jgi:hypothetical protein